MGRYYPMAPIANARAPWFPARLAFQLVAIQAVVRHAHAVAHADPVEGFLHERRSAPVAQLHRHAVVLVAGSATLDLVAGHGTADRSGDGGGILAAAAAD